VLELQERVFEADSLWAAFESARFDSSGLVGKRIPGGMLGIDALSCRV
jgi:hypothetical protein